jgi:NAD-dependent deacetylase
MNGIEILKKAIAEGEKIVFFGGAGVSCASGIPDFRGSAGLYNEKSKYGASPEEILHISYMQRNPKGFYEYYKDNMLYPGAKPNAAHRALAKLEAAGKLTAVVTQNIDGLHQLAGSRNVFELHGTVRHNYCVRCYSEYTVDHIIKAPLVPKCTNCGGIVRPDVVLYGEGLDGYVFEGAKRAIAEADVLIVGGTSLTVNPAAALVNYYGGEHFIIINKTPTPYDMYAEAVIREPIEEVLAEAVKDI